MNVLTAVELAVVTVGAVVVGVGLVVLVGRALTGRPTRRTSARERLLTRNPWLRDNDALRWTVRARRVHVDRLTSTLVGVALTLVMLRPSTTVASDDDR